MDQEVIEKQMKNAFTKAQAAASTVTRFTDLSIREAEEFRTILDNLNGSKDSIKNAKLWATQHGSSPKDIAKIIRQKAFSSGAYNFDQKLFVLYLVNDLLHDCLTQRSAIERLDSMSLSLLFILPELLALTIANSGQSERQRVFDLLSLWEDRLIFNGNTIDDLRTRMLSFDTKKLEEAQNIEQKTQCVNVLHLSPGCIVDLVKGSTPYQPMDSRRIPLRQENPILEIDNYMVSQLETFERRLAEIDISLKKNVFEYRRKSFL